MLRPLFVVASLLSLIPLVAVGCGPDTSNCTTSCQAQEAACPLTAIPNSECISECTEALDGFYRKSDQCGQAYDAYLTCEANAQFRCDVQNTPPSGCNDEQAAYEACGVN